MLESQCASDGEVQASWVGIMSNVLPRKNAKPKTSVRENCANTEAGREVQVSQVAEYVRSMLLKQHTVLASRTKMRVNT